METKKLGFLIIGMSIVLSFIIFGYMGKLSGQEKHFNCNPTNECQQVQSLFGLSHIAVGFLAFIFALGFYLLFFNKGEKEILKEANEEKTQNTAEDKFNLLLRPLDDNERNVLKAIKEQEGITQSTLKYRANLSKAKVSQILTDFEKKNLIARKVKGKTYELFLTGDF
jgi:uncharacterized membrane protein